MTIYIDSDYKCHTAAAQGLTAVDSTFFDGKCDFYIQGYRYVPQGERWTREDGVEFTGEMIAPWAEHEALDKAQREYERERMAEMQSALELLGVTT